MHGEKTQYDAVILTDARYEDPVKTDEYTRNVLLEDGMLMEALVKRGLKVGRVNWDNPDFDWTSARYIIFRTTWDYFERFPEFDRWLERTRGLTSMINPYKIIRWNIDKHYLLDLQKNGINIPPTLFIEPGDPRSLDEICESSGWSDMILKPAVSGGARHTYKLCAGDHGMKRSITDKHAGDISIHEDMFRELITNESMMLQEFQRRVTEEGELALMVFGGRYSHTILKKAKPGDFRVQDDFGGSVHDYRAGQEEIEFAEKVVSVCKPLPVYARVDIIRDNNNDLCVTELELIEPELWFRNHPPAAESFANAFQEFINNYEVQGSSS
jgi:glutathione synthase/RimK-type ligase-like ATP-grasp enzyme